jgi:hypothetical protein
MGISYQGLSRVAKRFSPSGQGRGRTPVGITLETKKLKDYAG